MIFDAIKVQHDGGQLEAGPGAAGNKLNKD